MAQRALILGAAGRDFHNFNTYFRDNDLYDVIAFTATQIPDIEGRTYPAELAGPRYPNGIPIEAEEDFERLIRDLDIDVVVFAYSDVTHEQVMHLGSRAIAALHQMAPAVRGAAPAASWSPDPRPRPAP